MEVRASEVGRERHDRVDHRVLPRGLLRVVGVEVDERVGPARGTRRHCNDRGQRDQRETHALPARDHDRRSDRHSSHRGAGEPREVLAPAEFADPRSAVEPARPCRHGARRHDREARLHRRKEEEPEPRRAPRHPELLRKRSGHEHPRHGEEPARQHHEVDRRQALPERRVPVARLGVAPKKRMRACKDRREHRKERDRADPPERHARAEARDHAAPGVRPEALGLARAHAAHGLDAADRCGLPGGARFTHSSPADPRPHRGCRRSEARRGSRTRS